MDIKAPLARWCSSKIFVLPGLIAGLPKILLSVGIHVTQPFLVHRYGNIISTKAILDKNTNKCKGEFFDTAHFFKCLFCGFGVIHNAFQWHYCENIARDPFGLSNVRSARRESIRSSLYGYVCQTSSRLDSFLSFCELQLPVWQ